MHQSAYKNDRKIGQRILQFYVTVHTTISAGPWFLGAGLGPTPIVISIANLILTAVGNLYVPCSLEMHCKKSRRCPEQEN